MTCLWEIHGPEGTVGKFLEQGQVVTRAERSVQKIALWPNCQGRGLKSVIKRAGEAGLKCTLHDHDYHRKP